MFSKKSSKEIVIKKLLKEANKAITGKNVDPETAIEHAEEVLKLDRNNYYGWLFKGTAYFLLGRESESDGNDDQLNESYRVSIKCLTRASEINSDAIYPWKTITEIRALDPNFVDFFSAVEKCAEMMAKKSNELATQTAEVAESNENLANQQISYCVLSNDDINMLRFTINDYINKFDYKNNESLYIHYLHSITPHLSSLGTILGSKIEPPVQSVETLIKIYQENEKRSIKSAIQRAKTSWSINASAHDKFFREADVKWSIYKDSKIITENLWNLLVDLESLEDEKSSNDIESKRWKAMARQVDYLNQLLFCAPDGTRAPTKPKRPLVIGKTSTNKIEHVDLPKNEKGAIREQILDIVSTLVLVKAPIQTIWDQHFEWSDAVSLFKLDIQEVANYIKLFGKDHGMGKLFYLFAVSEISPWDKDTFSALLNQSKKSNQKQKDNRKSKKNRKNASKENLEDKEDTYDDGPLLGSQQIFEEMTDVINGPSVSNMLVAHRIYLSLTIHVHNYQLALEYSTKYAALLADLKLKTGFQFDNSSLEHAFNLAIIYTYFESPKNFPKAEKLYTKVLASDPDNVRAMIGMARIKMELNAYDESKRLLESTLAKLNNQPHKIDLSEVLIEYGWCCIKLGDYEAGRTTLEKAKELVFGNYENSIEKSSTSKKLKGAEEGSTDVLDDSKVDQTDDNGEHTINESEKSTDATEELEPFESNTSLDVKTTLLYREALSYVLEVNMSESTKNFTTEIKTAYIQKAFNLFISCIKIAPTYAPAYTELGELYESQAEHSQDDQEEKANKVKAFKCFYRAFELDPGELRSAYAVTEYFANKCDWDMVELVSNAVIDNERAKKIILKNSKAKQQNKFFGCWPYRSLGIAHLEKQDDNKAIEYFQNSLRIDQNDYPSWIALGEAYLFKGKVEAAKRVFEHVICSQVDANSRKIDTVSEVNLNDEMLRLGDPHAIYFLAVAENFMGEHGTSFELLNALLKRDDILEMKPSILSKVCEVMVSKSGREIHSGAFKRSLSTLSETFMYFRESFAFKRSLTTWKFYGDALLLCLNIRSHISKLPFDIINQIIDISLSEVENSRNNDMKDIWDEMALGDVKLNTSDSDDELLLKIHYALTLSSFAALGGVTKETSKTLLTSLIYNLAISFICWYDDSKDESHRNIATKLLKKALQLEPKNAGYWNALGLTCMDRNSRVSQHCFIKSLSIDTKSPVVWFNLGMLYLRYKDYELANQAFTRSQSIAPSSSFAWAGQAVVADANGNKQQASTLFTHSYVLSNGKNASSTLLYSANALEKLFINLADERNLENVQQITAATSAMLKYLNYYPTDTFGLEVICSIIERLHDYEKGLVLSKKLCDLLKTKYESDSNSKETMTSYAKVLVQLARIQLGKGDFKESLQTTDKIRFILDKLFEMNLFDEVIQRIQLSTYTASGLSKYFLGDYDGSLQELNSIVESFPDIRRVVVLISQVLYALGSEQTKEAAVEELLSNMQEQGSSLLVVMTIAAMAITENWPEYMDAVKDELDMLDLNSRIEDTYKEVPMLQNIINEKLGIINSHIWQRSAFMFPQETFIWNHLNEKVALDVSNASNNVDANSLAHVYVSVGGLREMQRGLLLSPGSFSNHSELLSGSSTVE